jgi:hypothetical protein
MDLCKSLMQIILVFVRALYQVRSHTNVERAVPLARHHVDTWALDHEALGPGFRRDDGAAAISNEKVFAN